MEELKVSNVSPTNTISIDQKTIVKDRDLKFASIKFSNFKKNILYIKSILRSTQTLGILREKITGGKELFQDIL